ncbi:PcfK-like family protein [Anaerovorax odorimutans]|nr:PcfK-like family protein [Anaerovorax odorimutans]
MIDKAIAHITEQMMQLDQPLMQLIEEHLTGICTTTAVAERLLAEDKSLKNLNDKVWSEARKRKKGDGAYIPESEIFAMAEEYYGITEEDKNTPGNAGVIDILDLI